MRIWSLHPRYLDAKGLVAAWREGLLAQKVLEGRTEGYRSHPQLERFRAGPDPLAAVARYLVELAAEAARRGYSFDAAKIGREPAPLRARLPVAGGQLRYELELLRSKLELRAPERLAVLGDGGRIELNGAFREGPGGIEAWERVLPEIAERAGLSGGGNPSSCSRPSSRSRP
jgi:hypothetical protein